MFLVFLGAVNANAAMQVSAEWDQSADFSRLKTYGWLPIPPEQMQDTRVNYLLLDPRVKGSVDIDLRFKGYEKVTEGTPDFLIGYQAVLEDEMDFAVMLDVETHVATDIVAVIIDYADNAFLEATEAQFYCICRAGRRYQASRDKCRCRQ